MKQILVLFCLFCLASCKSHYITKKTIIHKNEILAIGNFNGFDKDFETITTAILKNKIRIRISEVPFTEKSFNSYTEQLKYLGKTTNLSYIDSIKEKPYFVVVELTDKVGYITELNNEYNKEVLKYLKQSEDLELVSSISLVLQKNELQTIQKADDFYLETSQNKKVLLFCFQKGKEIGKLDLNSGFVLEYQVSNFCWGKTETDIIELFDIIKTGHSCSQGTYKNANEIKPKTYDFKEF